MFNNVVLIGRVCKNLEVTTYESGLKVCNFDLAVSRPFKNEEGENVVDFIPITLWYGIAEATAEYCKKGALICVKGRLQIKYQEINEKKYKFIEMIGDNVIFLSRGSNEEV